jgi:hypothetical protein
MDTKTSKLIGDLEEQVKAVAENLATLKVHLLGASAEQPGENEGERVFRTKIGPFLNAMEAAGGDVTSEEFGALGRRFGYDPRGLGGFATGSNPSIRSEGDRRILTARGKALAAQWRAIVQALEAQLTAQSAEVQRYAALHPDRWERAQFRITLADLAKKWRESVQAAATGVSAVANMPLDGAPTHLRLESNGINPQAGIDNLIAWGVLQECFVGGGGRQLLEREVLALCQATWWRGLAEVAP